MNTRSRTVNSVNGKDIVIRVAPGRFIITNSNENDYINLININNQHKMAKRKAVKLSGKYKPVNIRRYT